MVYLVGESLMAIVSSGLFKKLKHTKANMNHPMDEKTKAANDMPLNPAVGSRSKISLKKSV